MNINQVWPEWNEDCVLGEGSFGKVYRAKRVEYGRTFYSAIKVITVPKNQQEIKFARSQGMNDGEIYNYFGGLVENLINEITLMDNLKGAKNIVGIEDYKIIEHEGEIGWDIFIRMELLSPFDSFISNPEFSQKDVIKLGVDICSALEVCEQNYIVHRDIKPDNIFISRFGEYKLGDFGIARKLEVTQANLSRKGTLNFMAPEVYKSEQYGSNVDIYSLGLVLYTLLNNNRVPFLPPYPQPISYKDNEEALSKRLSGQIMFSPCNASASLSAVILKACAYRPEDRYQTATEFKNALILEWNSIAQSGENKEINTDVLHFDNNVEQKLQRTTNDMTANGRVLVNEYNQDTDAFNNSGYVNNESASMSYSEQIAVELPVSYPRTKSSKICRVLAIIMAVVLCGMCGWMLYYFRYFPPVHSELTIFALGAAICVLLSDKNKIAVGISLVPFALLYILYGLNDIPYVLFHWDFPSLYGVNLVFTIVYIISGMLLLFGSIVIITQKEVKLGGSLCAASFAIELIAIIYLSLNDNGGASWPHIPYLTAIFMIFIWAYGYKKEEHKNAFKIIMQILSYIVSAVFVISAIGTAFGMIGVIADAFKIIV